MARSIREFLGSATNNYIPPGGSQGQSLIKRTNVDYDTEWSEGSGTGVTAYATIAELPLSDVDDGAMAFVAENNRLYIWNGVGWFNIALINTNPTITQGPNPSYVFATDGTPIVITLLATDPEGIPITWSSQVTSGTLGNTAVISQDDNVFTITPSTNSEDRGSFGVTFTASDGVNIATAASSFTLVFAAADQFYNQSIVLTTSSVNNGNNNVFVDSSNNNFAITRNGNTTQGTFSPYSPAGWSAYFDGNGDNLLLPFSTAFNLPGDFTIELWVNLNTHGGVVLNCGGGLNVAWASYQITSNADGINFAASSANNGYTIGSETGTTGRIGTIQLGRWNHIAITRSGDVYRGFVNGVQGYTQTLTLAPYNQTTRGLSLGGGYANTWGTSSPVGVITGNLSSVRIIKGAALYTSNFTPPTEPLTVVSGTSLLTLQDNRFIDRSTNNFTITRNGDTRITPFSPFIPQNPYDPSVHGGSAYFDGTGDYISNTSGDSLNFGTGAFTVEMWLYADTVSTTQFQVAMTTNPQSNNGFQIYNRNTSTALVFGGISVSEHVIISNMIPSQWYHIAVSRVSTGTNQTFVFVNGVLTNTYTVTDNFNINGFNLGGYNTSIFWNGYISNVRVVKGTALYTANFTPPAEPLTPVANTSLLLNFTNSNIFDETGKVVLETVGDAKVSTSVVKYGDGSIAFDGSGDYLVSPDPLIVNFGTGDFTVECWMYIISNPTYATIFDSRSTGGFLNTVCGVINTAGTLYLDFVYAGARLTGTTPIATSQWNHLSISRSSGVIRLFVNGIADGSVTYSTTIVPNGTNVWFGAGGKGGTPIYFDGHISDLRVTKGHARYTANFTPPTAKLGYNNAE